MWPSQEKNSRHTRGGGMIQWMSTVGYHQASKGGDRRDTLSCALGKDNEAEVGQKNCLGRWNTCNLTNPNQATTILTVPMSDCRWKRGVPPAWHHREW